MKAAIRRALKLPLLWLNAWRFKRSEGACASLVGRHENTKTKLYREHLRQMKLRVQREQIRNW